MRSDLRSRAKKNSKRSFPRDERSWKASFKPSVKLNDGSLRVSIGRVLCFLFLSLFFSLCSSLFLSRNETTCSHAILLRCVLGKKYRRRTDRTNNRFILANGATPVQIYPQKRESFDVLLSRTKWLPYTVLQFDELYLERKCSLCVRN